MHDQPQKLLHNINISVGTRNLGEKTSKMPGKRKMAKS